MSAEDKKYDAIQLCDGMSMMEVIRAITIMPPNAVLRLPVISRQEGLIRMRVEFAGDDPRPWIKQDSQG